MDQAFRDAMTAGYALTEPGLVIGSPMLDGELANDARVQVALSMLNRHGLIAGRDRDRQDQDAPAARRPAVEGRRAGLRRRHQGRPDRARRARRRDQPEGHRARRRRSAGRSRPSGHPVEFLSLSGQARRPGPGDGPLVRAAAARQGPRPQRDPDLDPRRWSSSTATTTTCRCSTSRTSRRRSSSSRPTRASRSSADYGGMSSASVGVLLRSIDRPRAGRRRRLLRRARVRRRRPAADDARRRGHHQHPRAVGRHGQAAAVLARSCSGCSPSCTSACPRRATCPSRSCASSSTRRTCCSTTRPRR